MHSSLPDLCGPKEVTIYFACITRHVAYSPQVWRPLLNEDSKRVEKLQCQASRFTLNPSTDYKCCMLYCIAALGKLVNTYVLESRSGIFFACILYFRALCTISFCCIVIIHHLLLAVFIMLSILLSRYITTFYSVLA